MEARELTILKSVEKVHQISQDSMLLLERYEAVKTELNYILAYFQITEIQSIFLASVINLSCLDTTDLKKLLTYFKMEKINILPYLNDVQHLVDKNILNKSNNRHRFQDDYSLNQGLLEFLVANKEIPIELISVLPKESSFHEFLKDLDDLSDANDSSKIDYRSFLYKFKKLLEENRKYKLVNYACENLEPIDCFVFFDTILDAIAKCNNDFNSNLQSTVEDFTEKNRETFDYVSKFLLGKTKLNTLNLVEKDQSQFADRHRIRLTEKAINLLRDMEGITFMIKDGKNDKLIYPNKIPKNNLFYNPAEAQLLQPVDGSLSKTSFASLQKRLKTNNMPTGLSVLLYGAPGTGKTETVYQMAKKHKRPIFKVEISETKSMWFGESQKLVKKIFTDYYAFKKQEKICPILLFNEADAVIGKRKAAGSSSVSDTENAIQNILLEELESFDGILFATSNLVANLDPAFERRFLFKIKFESPSAENAAKIWKNKLPTLSEKEASHLANTYNYSGGEMANIARKCIMEEVVLGNSLTFEKIVGFCDSEKWDKKTTAAKIGF